jgi:hypothetical protein
MRGSILTLLFFALACSGVVTAQDRGIEFLTGPEFILSESAIAAGIDGTLTVSFTVDRTGAVKDVDVLAGPVWPCNATPGAEIKKVREQVKQNIQASKFSPATKAGKPIAADATLDFAIGEAYKEALSGKSISKNKWVVDVANMQAKARQISVPSWVGINGSTTVRIIIGERGNVISAGTIRGPLALHATSRKAACNSLFPQTLVDGKPVKVTSVIHYDFVRGYVRAR